MPRQRMYSENVGGNWGLPAGYLESATEGGRQMAAGISSAGDSIAAGIEKYHKNKEARDDAQSALEAATVSLLGKEGARTAEGLERYTNAVGEKNFRAFQDGKASTGQMLIMTQALNMAQSRDDKAKANQQAQTNFESQLKLQEREAARLLSQGIWNKGMDVLTAIGAGTKGVVDTLNNWRQTSSAMNARDQQTQVLAANQKEQTKQNNIVKDIIRTLTPVVSTVRLNQVPVENPDEAAPESREAWSKAKLVPGVPDVEGFKAAMSLFDRDLDERAAFEKAGGVAAAQERLANAIAKHAGMKPRPEQKPPLPGRFGGGDGRLAPVRPPAGGGFVNPPEGPAAFAARANEGQKEVRAAQLDLKNAQDAAARFATPPKEPNQTDFSTQADLPKLYKLVREKVSSGGKPLTEKEQRDFAIRHYEGEDLAGLLEKIRVANLTNAPTDGLVPISHTSGTGGVTVVRGHPDSIAAGRPVSKGGLPEWQAKLGKTVEMMSSASKLINEIEAEGRTNVNYFFPRMLEGKKGNDYKDARLRWVMTVLREESGAAISESEYANAYEAFFPTWGDTKEQWAIKAESRERAYAAYKKMADSTMHPGENPEAYVPKGKVGTVRRFDERGDPR